MTTSDPQASAEEIAAAGLRNGGVEVGSVGGDGYRLLLARHVVAALRDAGFIVTRLDEATKEAMVNAGSLAFVEVRPPPERGFMCSAVTLAKDNAPRLKVFLDAALRLLTDSTDQPVKGT